MTTFAEFWPFYLREHAQPATRKLHFVGTSLATASLAAGAVTGLWGFFVAAPLFGYSFAWASHFGIEKNRPATFQHPFWSFAADYRMLACAVTGTLEGELKRAGVAASASA